VFRFELTTAGRAGHALVPGIGDNALARVASLVTALSERRPPYEPVPEVGALLSALGLPGGDHEVALAELERGAPELATLIEPMARVTFAPTMLRAGEKINVIPSHAELQVDCRVPPELGEEHVRRALAEVLGEDGFEIEFKDPVVGNRSPAASPLMEAIEGFVAREDPGAEVAPLVMTGFSDSHWWRAAFPESVVYGFFPQRAMSLVEFLPLMHAADERIPVADLGLAASFYSDLMVETLR
jgi:acetylornithine deacetylase/succinyl-diaminopimelate desuccinylase-like protein